MNKSFLHTLTHAVINEGNVQIYNSYHDLLFSPTSLKKVVDRISAEIVKLQNKHNFDAIVVTGISGTGMAFPVSYITGIPVVVVRKTTRNTHGKLIEGPNISVKKYIILDDFVVTGDSVKRVKKQMDKLAKQSKETCECVGVVTYTAKKKMTKAIDVSYKKEENHFIPHYSI